MQDRIKKILDYSGMNQQDFANRIAISPASLTNILKGRSNATLPIVMSIRASFPEINFDWLLDGKGEMLNTDGADMSTAQGVTPAMPDDLFAIDISDEAMPSSALNVAHATMPVSATSNIPLQASPSAQPIPQNASLQSVKYIDKPQRRVKEIQVFYDDDTYEVFVPRKS